MEKLIWNVTTCARLTNVCDEIHTHCDIYGDLEDINGSFKPL
jgi:hypothetical protein